MALLLGIESSSEYCTVLLCENGEIKSIVQHPPSLLQNAKSALHILPDAFEVRREVPLK